MSEFGVERLTEVLARIVGVSPSEFVRRCLLDKLRDFTDGTSMPDRVERTAVDFPERAEAWRFLVVNRDNFATGIYQEMSRENFGRTED